MAAVGFDLYTRMLAEAVEVEKAALEGRPARLARTQARIDLPVDAYLPDDYVPEEPQKLELYRRLGRVVSDLGLDEIRRELLDRFGPLPPPVERLLEVSQLRYRAEEAGLTSVGIEEGSLLLRFGEGWSRADTMRSLAPRSPSDPLRALAGSLRYGSNQLRVRPPGEAEAAWQLTRALVDRLADGASKAGATMADSA
jgi:transcription-repair coupling factor (superfamily II helicase)